MQNPRLLLCLPLLLAAIPGCYSEGDSCDAAIGGISLDADVYNDGDTIVAHAAFEFGDMSGVGGTALRLCATDDVLINGESTDEVDPISGRIYYEALFTEEQDEYEFRFTREGEEDVVATVVMPDDFEIDAPSSDDTLSRADGLTIEWSPGVNGGEMEVDVEGETDDDGRTCLRGQGEIADDNGSITFSGDELAISDSEDSIDECRVDVRLERENTGTYPSEFEGGGSVTAWRTHSTNFLSTP